MRLPAAGEGDDEFLASDVDAREGAHDGDRHRHQRDLPQAAPALEEAVLSNADHTTHQLQQVVRRVVGRWVNEAYRRRPMIIPLVIEA